ncbi:hypothetical protein FGE12_22965 [Aggregicoccus sp. 17bor-14]|uniref:type II toxin-antitoxin system RelE family toxin n=1 Tax=Myxococcaceae TaxID=31 RepID=UPI00129D20E3|nr:MULTISPECIES: hypothetical protein [Myxococcaceae]MBF5045285.1 hypothetical protein [Simulacricoccus sp. 17bor-14]MRI91026.1 hypothetical protein [Aggregicoccus sp. 17bor-14]
MQQTLAPQRASPSSSYRRFGVEYSQEAWRQLSALGWEDFRDVQRVLDALAEALSESPPRVLPPGGRFLLRAGRFVLGYSLRAEARTVCLCLFSQLPPGARALGRRGDPPEA